MRVMLLSDETYALMCSALEKTDEGWSVLARFEANAKAALPSDRQTLAIVRAARATPDEVPELVSSAVERRDAGRAVADETREAVERLMFHLADAGVSPSTLIRWFGYGKSRYFQLAEKRATAVA